MKRLLSIFLLLLSGKYVLATKEGEHWSYISNCDDLDKLDCALDFEEKCMTRLDNIPNEDYQAEINLAAVNDIINS